MFVTKTISKRRKAFTLVEMLVVIAIILVIAALAAAFAPRVNDSQNLTRAIDNMEQWLLSAKMRAKRDGLATGVRFVAVQGDVGGTYSQIQYIQQPDPLTAGVCVGAPPSPLPANAYQYPPPSPALPQGGNYYIGGTLVSASSGSVTFQGVDFSLGGLPQYDASTPPRNQWLVQPGDFLEVRDYGIFSIYSVTGANTVQLGGTTLQGDPYYSVPVGPNFYISQYESSLSINQPTTNYRILRQPRILIGEEPMNLPNNFAVDMNTLSGASVAMGSFGAPEILFSPTGAVVGSNAASGRVYLYVHDMTQTDPNMAGIIAIQCRTGFIGAYSVAPGNDPFYYAEIARESGL